MEGGSCSLIDELPWHLSAEILLELLPNTSPEPYCQKYPPYDIKMFCMKYRNMLHSRIARQSYPCNRP
jgi:hypothetical protein